MPKYSTRKTIKSPFPFKRVFFFFLMGLLFLGILVTVFFSIPNMYSYLLVKGYISPLSSHMASSDALGEIVTCERIKEKLEKTGFVVDTATDYDQSCEIILKSGEKIIFSKKKPLDIQISSLQLISSRLTIDGKHFTMLDLRFDRPVLVSK